MKKLKLNARSVEDILSRDEMKKVFGGSGSGSGSGSGGNSGGSGQECNCNTKDDCGDGEHCGRCDGTDEGPVGGYYGICSTGMAS